MGVDRQKLSNLALALIRDSARSAKRLVQTTALVERISLSEEELIAVWVKLAEAIEAVAGEFREVP